MIRSIALNIRKTKKNHKKICSDARSTPNQSKSFRVLQQITDTMKTDPAEISALNKPAELQQAHYARPLGPNDMNEHQLRKLKLNDQQSQQQQQQQHQPFEGEFLRLFCDKYKRPNQPVFIALKFVSNINFRTGCQANHHTMLSNR